MKRYLLILLTVFPVLAVNAQSRGIKIAYIDMEYILDKVPDYAEAKNQLELKAQQWKQEIEVKKNDIVKLKESLKTERAFLTKELIEEREEEIGFLEKELLDYQEKKFGPKGDLISQKSVLVKPIQDQVFNIVQDLAEARTYDFILDKSSDLTILFAAKRHDISDLIVRRLTRASKREQLTKKELKKLEEVEAKEELEADPAYADKQKKLEDRKAERERLLNERKAAQDEKRKAYEERREQLKQERDAKRNGTTPPVKEPATGATATPVDKEKESPAAESPKETTATPKNAAASETPKNTNAQNEEKKNAAQAAKEERERKLEERKKALEEKRQKAIQDREDAKKAREEKMTKNKNTPPANNDAAPATNPEKTDK